MAIEIVGLPIKNCNFPLLCGCLPEGKSGNIPMFHRKRGKKLLLPLSPDVNQRSQAIGLGGQQNLLPPASPIIPTSSANHII
jgi:hypothetical protein